MPAAPAADREGALAADPLWYKDAIIYELHVKAFFDSNGDGIGDFRGLTQKLDYLQDLGVNTLWLLPFYPSPLRDDGYDISDYRAVHPDYGTLKDFRAFVREAHCRGLRVITELVINHTSDQHPWFKAARKARPGSAKRNFYVWSDTDQQFPETRIIFSDTESSNWAWDPVARAYYWHRFFSHQPDLNHNNPRVVDAVIRVMNFWLDMGVDGLRLDAIPYLCVREGTCNENLPETHAVLKRMRTVVDQRYKDRMFLAEANQWPEDVQEYFGCGDECHVAYHFPLMPRMYMAMAQEDRHPIVEIMDQTPDIPASSQWGIFLRNHDELTLEMVTDRERDYMYQVYAMDRRMRLNLGIRRRLAPLMENERGKIDLLNSLLMSMPGSPIIYYGDEIGMGDNIYLGDRNGVRTPMQWSPDRNAGFSITDPARLYLPPLMDSVYGFEAVNAEGQARSPSSLLNWMKRLIAVRKAHQAFGRGTLTFLHPGNRKILAYLREYNHEAILCVANLARSAQPVELDLSRFSGQVPVEMMGRTAFPPIGELPYFLTLPGHGFYWFLLTSDAQVPSWHEDHGPPKELPMLVLSGGLQGLFPDQVEPSRKALAERACDQFMRKALPGFIVDQRWFAAKGETIERIEFVDQAMWSACNCLLALFQITMSSGAAQEYFIPLSLIWEQDDGHINALLPYTVTRVRQQARTGIIIDAFADETFCRAFIEAIGAEREIRLDGGVIYCPPTSAYAEIVGGSVAEDAVSTPGTESSNTTIIIGGKMFLKGYRRLQEGLNPELEIGRFLTERSRFAYSVPVAGGAEYQPNEGPSRTLAILQSHVANQGSGWSYTLDYLKRFLEDVTTGAIETFETAHDTYLELMRILGQRTGELHVALAVQTGDPDFDPEPVTHADVRAWVGQVLDEAQQTLARLGQSEHRDQPDVQSLLAVREALIERIRGCEVNNLNAAKTRYQGDYHLGQVLLAHNDFVIIDFEGEPARTLKERRQKHSPLKDVAGMLRSFNYAAYAALFEATEEQPPDFAQLEPNAREWEQMAAMRFLAGYDQAARTARSYPSNPEHAQHLIELFTLEKALYEVRYELANRPKWLPIPVKGLLTILTSGR
ncbi:MAG TPA: maltose alpha-D-glucosyltransferase [Gammaproteobacteria bacterium]|nr:maltose alpha-D-glucosyltransferase [Gammaproteobacteria bacterium]